MLVYYMYNFDILIPLNSTYTSYTACAKKTYTLQLPIYFRPFYNRIGVIYTPPFMTRVGTLILRQFPEKNPNLPQAAGTNRVQKPPRTHT